jgi:hypothetical protein
VKARVGDCDFIMINETAPTNPFLSSGFLDAETAEKAAELIGKTERKPRPAILVGHFPIKTAGKSLGNRRGLRGDGRTVLEKLLESGAIDLSLCGHEHSNAIAVDETGRGEARAGAVTASGDLNIIDYDSERNAFSIEKILPPYRGGTA